MQFLKEDKIKRCIIIKSLNTIQILSKIGKIFSKVCYILAIVGFCGCVVGIIALIVGEKAVELSCMTLQGIIELEGGVTLGTVYSAIAVGILLCAGEFAVSLLAYRYFSHELEAGTPFTLEGANELLRLGIHVIWIPIAATVAAKIAHEIIAGLMVGVAPVELSCDEVAFGVMFIVMSVLCRYGAELIAAKPTEAAPDDNK